MQTEPFSDLVTIGVDDTTTHSFEGTKLSDKPLPAPSDTDLLEKYTPLDMPPLDDHIIKRNGRLRCTWAGDPPYSHSESSRTAARKHLKTHVRPYQCDVCGLVRTAEQADIKEHLKTHIPSDLRERF